MEIQDYGRVAQCVKFFTMNTTHTHTHKLTRAHTRTHTHTHTRARAHTHTHIANTHVHWTAAFSKQTFFLGGLLSSDAM